MAQQGDEAGAVESRRLDLLDGDLAHGGQEHDGEEAPPVPDVDGGDGVVDPGNRFGGIAAIGAGLR
jgi:hypothetical protein